MGETEEKDSALNRTFIWDRHWRRAMPPYIVHNSSSSNNRGGMIGETSRLHSLTWSWAQRPRFDSYYFRVARHPAMIDCKLRMTDNPADWSVDALATNGAEYEVRINAYNGKVIAIILGG